MMLVQSKMLSIKPIVSKEASQPVQQEAPCQQDAKASPPATAPDEAVAPGSTADIVVSILSSMNQPCDEALATDADATMKPLVPYQQQQVMGSKRSSMAQTRCDHVVVDSAPLSNASIFPPENLQECDELIRVSEERGYEQALVNIGMGRQKLMPNVRNNFRCIIDSEEIAHAFWERITEFIPQTMGKFGSTKIALNERLRFLRYVPGEYFKPHHDGIYQRDNGEASLITVQIYLNEGFQGGSTTFLSMDEFERVECVPKTGRVLIFEHRIYHEGSLLKKGKKYAIRTDVMYTPADYKSPNPDTFDG
ncbi:uncharacterized protein LOC117299646 [Asterias rubens]|uniref:uncharacterized protein LOC117299646 n=1 Tax=Asterias rubens TaxID=7604 RepID=UPI001455AFD9|nr:uncharacterized protein LOC117299646 [Asterias rubens]